MKCEKKEKGGGGRKSGYATLNKVLRHSEGMYNRYVRDMREVRR